MSVRVMSKVFESDLPAMEKLVLLALADHARDDGTGAYPSIGTLARKTSLSERGVQKVIRRLENQNLIVPRGLAKGGRGLTVEYDITLGKGERCSGFGSGKGEPEGSKRVNLSAEKGEPGSPESSRTILREPVAARIDRAKIYRPAPQPVENHEQQHLLFKGKTPRTVPAWVKGKLAEDLYRGIHNEKIAATFFDARNLTPHEQLAACLGAAVTTLVTNRVGTLKVLSADEIEQRAREELLRGLTTLALVKDFETRRRHTVQAVTRVVLLVCLRLLEARGVTPT